jgi:FkbM family methyltransferase
MIQRFRRAVGARFPAMAAAYHSYRLTRESYATDLQQNVFGFQFAGTAAMQNGSFEAGEVAVIRQQLEKADVFVDVGANVGYYTCLARHNGVHVVAVEPFPRNLEQLYVNLGANGWLDVEVFPVALSDKGGVGSLFGGGTGASLLPGWAGTSDVWRTAIPLSTLDVVLGGRFEDQNLLIKIDVEGAEHQVLKGASATLARRQRPVWLLEICFTENQSGINPHFAEVFELFWQNGYRATTADADRHVITPAVVNRWLANKRRDQGYVNYLFEHGS